MTTTLMPTMTTPAVPVRPLGAIEAAALRLAVTATPPPARLPIAVPSSVVTSLLRVSAVDVPAIDGNWSRGRTDFGMASYGKTIDAQAATHAKAVDPPRGTSV